MRELKRESFLNTEEVAKYLGFATRTITDMANQWIDSGGRDGLPGFKIGKRQWRFDPDKIAEWVHHRNPPATMAIRAPSGKTG